MRPCSNLLLLLLLVWTFSACNGIENILSPDTGSFTDTSIDAALDTRSPDTSPDAPTDTTTDAANTDASDTTGTADTTRPDVAPECTADIVGAPTGGFASAGRFTDFGGGVQYLSTSGNTQPVDRLSLEFFFALGDLADGPGTITFSGKDYADCSACALLGERCEGALNSFLSCQATFLVESGTLDITAMGPVGGRFSGVLRNAVFHEVTIDSNTSVATPVENGRTWCIQEHAFDVDVIDFDALP